MSGEGGRDRAAGEYPERSDGGDHARRSDGGAPTEGGDPVGSTDGQGVGWPVELCGVTESVVATLGPNGEWNLAALGLQGPDDGEGPVTARTWGRTRTRRNFEREGEGVVQFVRDPVLFVDAALGIVERSDPVDDAAHAWVRVATDRIDAGESGGTGWVDWRLTPTRRAVVRRVIPTTRRAHAAVVEATVAASRLDVDAYDESELLDRLEHLADVVDRCGDDQERAAFESVGEHVGWTDR
ncbi:DUF447 domain-containing protein [Halobacteriales archaeon QS_8_69_26]|nr:MAG: DUF447 domain-containing protein [Halobacteriales archaeon QS_8_69_26]